MFRPTIILSLIFPLPTVKWSLMGYFSDWPWNIMKWQNVFVGCKEKTKVLDEDVMEIEIITAIPSDILYSWQIDNNNNNNKHDNVYGAVIMAEPLREFTRFIWWMWNGAKRPPTQDQARWLRLWVRLYRLPETTPTIAIYYYSARKLILILPSHGG